MPTNKRLVSPTSQSLEPMSDSLITPFGGREKVVPSAQEIRWCTVYRHSACHHLPEPVLSLQSSVFVNLQHSSPFFISFRQSSPLFISFRQSSAVTMSTYYASAEYSRKMHNALVIKELAITRIDEDGPKLLFHGTFRPPCFLYELPEDVRRTNFYLHRCMHRIGWNAGQYSAAQVTQILQHYVPEVGEFVSKGSELVKYFSRALNRPVLDLDNQQPPPLAELPLPVQEECFIGHPIAHCAKFKAMIYAEWLSHNSFW